MLAVVWCGACGQGAGQDEPYAPVIDPAQFTAVVDNRFFPLVPGTTFHYQERRGTERVEVYVTADQKEIMGVPCVVVRSREYDGTELIEETLDWYAQDREGNVWYFGEDTKAYQSGAVVGTEGSWEAGRDGAQPGIIMLGSPQLGRRYRQEYYRGHAEDMGEVIRLGESRRVPYGTFAGVLVTKDWTPLERGMSERKYYAPGIGLILEAGGLQRVELVRVTVDGR